MPRFFLPSLFLGVASIALFVPSSALAWCQSCTVSRVEPQCAQSCFCPSDAMNIAWRRPCLTYSIHQRGSADLSRTQLEDVIDRSFSAWTQVQCNGAPVGFEVQLTQNSLCSVPEYVPDDGNVNSIAFVSDWTARDHARGAYALTTTWFRLSDGEIIDADMEINEQHWTWEICPDTGCVSSNPRRPAADLENTMTHELGHFLGMAHSDAANDATMWACADSSETLKRDLAADDQEGICAIYEAGFTEACTFVPRGGFDPTCGSETPPHIHPNDVPRTACGCRVGDSSPSRSTLFALLMLAGVVWQRRTRQRP